MNMYMDATGGNNGAFSSANNTSQVGPNRPSASSSSSGNNLMSAESSMRKKQAAARKKKIKKQIDYEKEQEWRMVAQMRADALACEDYEMKYLKESKGVQLYESTAEKNMYTMKGIVNFPSTIEETMNVLHTQKNSGFEDLMEEIFGMMFLEGQALHNFKSRNADPQQAQYDALCIKWMCLQGEKPTFPCKDYVFLQYTDFQHGYSKSKKIDRVSAFENSDDQSIIGVQVWDSVELDGTANLSDFDNVKRNSMRRCGFVVEKSKKPDVVQLSFYWTVQLKPKTTISSLQKSWMIKMFSSLKNIDQAILNRRLADARLLDPKDYITKGNDCSFCKKAFGVFRRKYNCSICGVLLCGKCTLSKLIKSTQTNVRVCSVCTSKPSFDGRGLASICSSSSSMDESSVPAYPSFSSSKGPPSLHRSHSKTDSNYSIPEELENEYREINIRDNFREVVNIPEDRCVPPSSYGQGRISPREALRRQQQKQKGTNSSSSHSNRKPIKGIGSASVSSSSSTNSNSSKVVAAPQSDMVVLKKKPVSASGGSDMILLTNFTSGDSDVNTEVSTEGEEDFDSGFTINTNIKNAVTRNSKYSYALSYKNNHDYPDAPIPKHESSRMVKVRSLCLIDNSGEFRKVCSLVADQTNCKYAAICFIGDKSGFLLSEIGYNKRELPRANLLDSHAIMSKDPTILINIDKDQRFVQNPIVTTKQIKFYAGFPLITSDNYVVGVLSVADKGAREAFTMDNVNYMKKMADLVMKKIEMQTKNPNLPGSNSSKQESDSYSIQKRKDKATMDPPYAKGAGQFTSMEDLLQTAYATQEKVMKQSIS